MIHNEMAVSPTSMSFSVGERLKGANSTAGIDPLIRESRSGEVFYFRIREKTRSRGAFTEDDFFQIRCRAVAGEAQEREGFFIWQTRDAARDAKGFSNWCTNRGPGVLARRAWRQPQRREWSAEASGAVNKSIRSRVIFLKK